LNAMNGSMGFGGPLSPKSSKNTWNVATSLMSLPGLGVITVLENYFWHSLVKVWGTASPNYNLVIHHSHLSAQRFSKALSMSIRPITQ
jgi:hypothetical protein